MAKPPSEEVMLRRLRRSRWRWLRWAVLAAAVPLAAVGGRAAWRAIDRHDVTFRFTGPPGCQAMLIWSTPDGTVQRSSEALPFASPTYRVHDLTHLGAFAAGDSCPMLRCEILVDDHVRDGREGSHEVRCP